KVFQMPAGESIDGPAYVTARANQDPEISRNLSLLNGSGSEVVLGNVIVVPIEKSLMYVQPLYVQAQNNKIPELKRVIVVYANQVAMQPTLQGALTQIFGAAPSTLEQAPSLSNTGSSTPAPNAIPGTNNTPTTPT